MTEQRREQLRLLVRILFAMAAAVLVLSVAGAIQIASSNSDIPIFGDIQQQNRGVAALAALGGGIVGAGVLAGLAGILTALLDSQEREP
jgi:hypothetical protein